MNAAQIDSLTCFCSNTRIGLFDPYPSHLHPATLGGLCHLAICRFGHESLCHSTWSPVSQIPEALSETGVSLLRQPHPRPFVAICQSRAIISSRNISAYTYICPPSPLILSLPHLLGLIDLIDRLCGERGSSCIPKSRLQWTQQKASRLRV